MIYQRRLTTTLNKQLDVKEITVLTGMRRVGKTTLYREIYDSIASENKVFLDMENPMEQKIFEEVDYNNVWANLKQYGINNKEKSYIFLDEVQAFPEIVRVVKYLYDHYNVKFFLTGSSSYYLKNLFPESLAGRKFVFELFPLDFQEFKVFKQGGQITQTSKNRYKKLPYLKNITKNKIRYEKQVKLYEEYLKYGGFPGVVLTENNQAKIDKLNDIFTSYFEKDIKGLSQFREIKVVRDLILLLMQRTGSKIDINKLSSELGVSRPTIYSYIDFLEATYFIYLVNPYTKSVDREISGTPKVYFCDTGILNAFSQVSGGSILENSVFLNLKKYGDVKYYQRRNGREIDFVLNKKTGVGVKMLGTKRELNNVVQMGSSLGLSKNIIVSKEYHQQDGFLPATEI